MDTLNKIIRQAPTQWAKDIKISGQKIQLHEEMLLKRDSDMGRMSGWTGTTVIERIAV